MYSDNKNNYLKMRDNLNYLENQEKITSDEILDSMCRLFDTAKGQIVASDDVEELGFNLYKLLNRISPLYNAEERALMSLNDADIKKAIDAANKIYDELEPKKETFRNLCEQKSKKEELRIQYNKIKADNSKLQDEISKIPEVSVESINQKNRELQDALNNRNKAYSDYMESDSKLNETEKERARYEKKTKNNAVEKKKKEEEIEDLKKQVDEYKDWQKKFDVEKQSIEEDYDEASAVLTAIKKAFNSFSSLQENQSLLNEKATDIIEACGSYQELLKWFETKGDEIEALIGSYECAYRKVLEIYRSVTTREV